MGGRISDDAVRRATGRGWDAWFTLLDAWGCADMDHASVARRLAAETDLSGWWAQTVTVAYERARGRRKLGQSKRGWQFSVQKTLPVDAGQAWEAVVSQGWLPAEGVEEGATFDIDGSPVTVRAVRPGKLLRLWWHHTDGRSTLEVQLTPRGGRTAVRFLQSGLPRQGMVEAWRTRWKAVLEGLAA